MSTDDRRPELGTDDRLREQLRLAILARVAEEPRPTPSRAFLASVRRGSLGDARASLATAWRLATLRTTPVAIGTRVRAAALALGVGAATLTSGAAALASVAGLAQQVAVQVAGPTPSERAEPQATPTPHESAAPSAMPTARPSERPAWAGLPRDDYDRDLPILRAAADADEDAAGPARTTAGGGDATAEPDSAGHDPDAVEGSSAPTDGSTTHPADGDGAPSAPSSADPSPDHSGAPEGSATPPATEGLSSAEPTPVG